MPSNFETFLKTQAPQSDSIGGLKVPKFKIPNYQKPILDRNLKLQAPTGKELNISELPEKVSTQYQADIREQDISRGKGENFLKTIARAPFRALQATTQDILKPEGGSQFVPQTNFEKFIFGEAPVKSLSLQQREAEETLKGSGYGKLSTPLAATAVLGGTLLDLTPFGGSRKALTKEIIEAGSDDVARALLKKSGVADDLIESYVPKIVKAKTTKEADAIISSLNDISNITQEARKYKSAEEFEPKTKGNLFNVFDENKKLLGEVEAKDFFYAEDKAKEMFGKNYSHLMKKTVDNSKLPAQDFSDSIRRDLLELKPMKIKEPQYISKTPTQQFETINEGGLVKKVDGVPINLIDGVNTFIHQGDNPKRTIKGFVITERSTGRYISSGETKKEAIDNAKIIINNIGEDKFKKTISQFPLLKKQDSVQDVVNKSLVLPKEKAINKPLLKVPQLSKSSTQEVVSDLNSNSLDKLYKDTSSKSIKQVAKNIKEPETIVKRVVNTTKKVMTDVIEYVQNSEKRVKDLIARKDVKVSDISDPYLKQTLYSGRVAEKVNQGKIQAQNIINESKKIADEFKTDLKTIRNEVNNYLKFKHAPERNLALGEKASGITTKEAQEGMKTLESLPRFTQIKQIAEKAQKLNTEVLDILKDSGVITDELYNTLRNKYKNHIPLQRIFEETDDIGQVLSGKGFDVKGTGIKMAVGSEKEVDDILSNIMTNYEQAVLRSEKNIVDNSTLNFVRENKDSLGDLMEIVKPKAVGKTLDGKMILEKTQDPTILQLFENGKPIWIKINDKKLAIALKGVGREKLGLLLNSIGKFTRFYSGLSTRFNPEFALANKIRDLQETAVYLASQKGIGFKGASKAVLRDLRQESTKSILDSIRGIDSEGAKLYNEMKQLGGTTGGFGLSTKQQVKMSIEKLEELANSKTKRFGNNLLEYIDNWNTIFEDSTRLSVYKQAIEQGLSKERAAFLAKEASINFNRMGNGGPVINALWMFSNASLQGSAKMINSLKNPKVLGATILSVGGAVSAVNQFNDNVDPDWRDKVSKWDRLNGLPVMIPTTDGGARYITIPVSWGLKPIKVMSDYAYDSISGENFNLKNFSEDTMTSILEAYNPVGGSDLVSALSPTIIDLPVELARNRSWSGSKIKPDYDQNAPEDTKYFDNLGETKTGQTAISISEALKKYTNIAISPADIKYSYDNLVGGLGRATSKAVNAITGGVTGKPIPLDEYPFISRFYKEKTEEEIGAGAGGKTKKIKEILGEQSRSRFYVQKEAEKLYSELKGKSKEEISNRLKELKNNPEILKKLKGIIEDKSLNLNYTDRLIKQLGIENGERSKYIYQEFQLMSKEEKVQYLKDLRNKGILTNDVAKQLSKLLSN